MPTKFLWKSLRANRYGEGVDVVGFANAPRGSVLAGQTLRHFIDTYPDEAAARRAHPDVTGYTHPMLEPQPSFNHLPGEDDPVPGGMYPDDY